MADTINKLRKVETGTLVNISSYAAAYTFNPEVGICTIVVNGTSTAPSAGKVTYTLPEKIRPRNTTFGNLRYSGSSIEVKPNGDMNLTLVAQTWNSGYITYIC